jgi:starch-binding outer membrane protein, SusD/RagB family
MFHSKNKRIMRSIKNITLGLATVGVMSLSGCAGDYLDTIPSTSVSETTINTSLDNLYIALNGIHKEMVSQESGYQCLGGEPGFMMSRDAEADDMNWQTNTWMKAAYLGWQCNMNETNGYNYKFWQIYYQWILNANKILAGLEEVEITSQELFDQIKGEALCIRAWAHFNLVQLYAKRYEAGKDNTQDGIPYREKAVAEEQARNFKLFTHFTSFINASSLILQPAPNDQKFPPSVLFCKTRGTIMAIRK